MITYEEIYECAVARKGSPEDLENLIQVPASDNQSALVSNERCLAEFTKKIFQSGFVWKVVDKKWQGFEEVFWGFDIDKLLMMPEEMLEQKAQDAKIIRNFRKVKTIPQNALMIKDVCERTKGSFGEFLSNWPKTDIVALWLYLKKNGSRLGGNTGPYALRGLGLDTFLLTKDVESFLRSHGIIRSGRDTKKTLCDSQEFFNELASSSGRTLCELSRIVAFAHGANWVGVSGAA